MRLLADEPWDPKLGWYHGLGLFGRGLIGLDGAGAQVGLSYGLYPVMSAGAALEVRRTWDDTAALDGERTLVGLSLEGTFTVAHVTLGGYSTIDDGTDETVFAFGAGIGF